jgi:hypothetical protein
MLLYSLLPSTSEDGTDPGEASNINNVQDICIHYQGGIVGEPQKWDVPGPKGR